MKLPFLALAAVFAAGATTWLASSTTPAPAASIEYTFREAPLNSLGVKSFSELRGRPVLVEFWGKN